jgi:hypothetical protein
MRALCREALSKGARLLVPAGVVGQATRDEARQVALRSLIHSRITEVPPLDLALAEALCGRRGTRDVIDASVAIVGKRVQATVVTSDPEDLRHLDSTLRIERL